MTASALLQPVCEGFCIQHGAQSAAKMFVTCPLACMHTHPCDRHWRALIRMGASFGRLSRVRCSHTQSMGSEGEADGQWRGPAGMAVTPNGSVIVADQLNHRLQVLGRL